MFRSLVRAGMLLLILLLGLGMYGLFHTPDFRSRFDEPLLGYDEALRRIARAHAEHGPGPRFLAESVSIYADATAYDWPEGLARVSVFDNWLLFLAASLDPLLEAAGLKSPERPFFAQFESYRYERALRRGFGICSQNAQGYADLLHREYGLTTRMVGLGGHVITQVTLPEGKFLADPSVGVLLPLGLAKAPGRLPEIRASYRKVGEPALWKTFDAPGNILGAGIGSGAYAAPQWRQAAVKRLEQVSEVAIVILPLLSLLLLGWLDRRMRTT